LNIELLINNYSSNEFDSRFRGIIQDIKLQSPLILIQGGYGKRNTGDDALLLVIYNKVKEIVPNSRVVALCHFPDDISKRYQIEAYHFAEKKAIYLLFKADMLIIGGGGIVNKINTFSGLKSFRIFDPKGKYLFLTSLLMKLRGKKAVFYVVGITSIPDAGVRYLMKLVLPKADLIGVRDVMSLGLLKELKLDKGVILCHDPALNLPAAPESDAIELLANYNVNIKNDELIGINVRQVQNEETNQKTIKEMVLLVDKLTESNNRIKIIFFPIGMHPTKPLENDLIIGRQIAKNIKNKERFILLDEYYSPMLTKALLGKMKILILSRLHSLILSCEYKIPTIIITYDDKVTQFGQMAGYDKIIPLEEINSDGIIRIIREDLRVG